MVNCRLKHPYLTQGRNYPKHKVHYKWTSYEIGESYGNGCNFHIDTLIWYGKKLKLVRHNCLHYLGHGTEHSYDKNIIIQHNENMKNVIIYLAWWKHIKNEFGKSW